MRNGSPRMHTHHAATWEHFVMHLWGCLSSKWLLGGWSIDPWHAQVREIILDNLAMNSHKGCPQGVADGQMLQLLWQCSDLFTFILFTSPTHRDYCQPFCKVLQVFLRLPWIHCKIITLSACPLQALLYHIFSSSPLSPLLNRPEFPDFHLPHPLTTPHSDNDGPPCHQPATSFLDYRSVSCNVTSPSRHSWQTFRPFDSLVRGSDHSPSASPSNVRIPAFPLGTF